MFLILIFSKSSNLDRYNLTMERKKHIAVIGAGFFGLNAALMLHDLGAKVTVFEKESKVMLGASLSNQARVHGGYHYPRSLQTAGRCQVRYREFLEEYSDAIYRNFNSFYAIAKDSKTSSLKFERFMRIIGAPFELIEVAHPFNRDLIESLYLCDEVAFNANILSEIILEKLVKSDVELRLNTKVTELHNNSKGYNFLVLRDSKGIEYQFDGAIIATYGQQNIHGIEFFNNQLVFEVCELLRVQPSTKIENSALTIMDGQFWSLTPWPAYKCFVLTNVRHTPHARFTNFKQAEEFKETLLDSRSEFMIREVSRYAPGWSQMRVLGSEFIVKTILAKSEDDDARPIAISRSKRILNLLGSKIDQVYDIDQPVSSFLREL